MPYPGRVPQQTPLGLPLYQTTAADPTAPLSSTDSQPIQADPATPAFEKPE